MIACRADVRACIKLVDAMDDMLVSTPARASARRTVKRSARRWPEVWYALARKARDPAALRHALTQGCAGDDGRACRDLAWRLERGDGMPAHLEKARIAGDRACRLGDKTLCLRELRRRQMRTDWAGIRRVCRRGDALSCAALDARQCLQGDGKACLRAAAVPPGACAVVSRECHGTPSLPPASSRQCTTTDSCAYPRRQQRTHAHRWLIEAAQVCAIDTVGLQVRVGRSGDVFAFQANPQLTPCLKEHVLAMRLPPAEAPSELSMRLVGRDGRPRAMVHVSGKSGTPIPRSALEMPSLR